MRLNTTDVFHDKCKTCQLNTKTAFKAFKVCSTSTLHMHANTYIHTSIIDRETRMQTTRNVTSECKACALDMSSDEGMETASRDGWRQSERDREKWLYKLYINYVFNYGSILLTTVHHSSEGPETNMRRVRIYQENLITVFL